MANSPVDRNQEIMQKEFGTKVLITDLASETYLKRSQKLKEQKKFTDFCGGKSGWDDYTERWH